MDNNFDNLLSGESQTTPTSKAEDEFTTPQAEAEDEFATPQPEKVELDIEGMFMEEPEGEAPPEDGQEPPSELSPDDKLLEELLLNKDKEATENQGRTMVAKRKRLLIIVPAAIVILSILGLIVKFVFFSPAEVIAPVTLIISPDAPPRDAVSGELALDPLYINFPGIKHETIVEMSLIIYFNDFPSRDVINNNLSTIRDIIFRITQSKGSEIIANGEMQQLLRQQLQDNINQTLGNKHISYIQIGQIRILQ